MDWIKDVLTNSAVAQSLGPWGIAGLAALALIVGGCIATRPSSNISTGVGPAAQNMTVRGDINITTIPTGAWIAFAAAAVLGLAAILTPSTRVECGVNSGTITGSEVNVSCD
ncbi:MAG: hypothetical protein AAGF71_10615 [Pseudomonadota bacterium]